MDRTAELNDLNDRLREVILGTCNTVGCKDCDLKWGDSWENQSCSSVELQNKIYDLEEEHQKAIQEAKGATYV